jgi:hypothetical protein
MSWVARASRRRRSPVVEGLESRELLAFTPVLPTPICVNPFQFFSPGLVQLAQIPTTLTLSGPANPVTVGQKIPFQAVVGISSGTTPPTGTVTFVVDNVAQPPAIINSSGIATIMLPSQTAGNHAVSASYSGNFLYAPSMNATTQLVNQGVTAGRLTASTTMPAVNQTVLLTVQLTVPAANTTTPVFSGQVTFTDNGVTIGSAPVGNGGTAQLSRSFSTTGGHTIIATYGGNTNFLPSQSNPVPLQVLPGPGGGLGGQAAPATVVGVERFGFHLQPTVLQVAFSSPMDPTRAQNPANYLIIGPGGNFIPVLSAAYDPTTQSVTLMPARRLDLHFGYVLAVVGSGPNGLTDTAGVPLAGMGGVPGTNYVTLLTAANLVIPGLSPLATLGFLGSFGLL